MVYNNKPVMVEQAYHVPISDIWEAITNIDKMRKWYFENIPEFKPEVGFTTEFIVKTEEREFLHIWKILEVIPLKKISYEWRYGGFSGTSDVTYELKNHNQYVKLKLTHNGIESFPQDIPEFTRDSCKQGWEYFIQQSLKTYLDGND